MTKKSKTDAELLEDASNQEKRRQKRLSNLVPVKKGEVRNPKGRGKSVRNKFGEAFLKDFVDVWDTNGKAAMIKVSTEDPSTFIRVAASILPKELNINGDNKTLEDFLEKFQTTEAIDEFIKGITAIGAGECVEAQKVKAESGSEPDILH